MSLAWHVARTKSRAEHLAKDQLESRGFEYFLPVVSTLSLRRGREHSPLFPGYLFLRHDTESPTPLHAISNLVGLVTFDGVAPVIPDDTIICLRQRVAEMNRAGGLRPRFRPGEEVWIRWGHCETEGLAEVVADAKSPHGRVRVLMDFLGRMVHAEVSQSNIRLAAHDDALMNEDRVRFRRRTRGKGRYLHGVGPSSAHNGRAST